MTVRAKKIKKTRREKWFICFIPTKLSFPKSWDFINNYTNEREGVSKNTLCVHCLISSVSMTYIFKSPDLHANQYNFRLLTSNFHICVLWNMELRRSGKLKLCVCWRCVVEWRITVTWKRKENGISKYCCLKELGQETVSKMAETTTDVL
jgi:hypothetical protein